MSNESTTQQILQAIEYAKSRAKSAERDFDRENSAIQRKASRSIDLFGGSATSTVADIARDARRACDNLFAAYQSLIITLDETCRPLLNNDPDMSAVKAVAELMKKLNDDSEIEANFTASLNGSSLGDVAGSRYVPSMNCKMIQRYWEDRYATWPGRAELEAAARQKEQQRKQQAEEAANKQYEAQLSLYEQKMQQYEADFQVYQQEHTQWEAAAKKVKAARETEFTAKQAEYEKKLQDNLLDIYNKKKEDARKKQIHFSKELEKANEALEQAGLFAFSAKKAAKQAIANATEQLTRLKLTINYAGEEYETKKKGIPAELRAKEASFKAEIEKKHPMPAEPVAPAKPVKPVKPRSAFTPGYSSAYRADTPGNEDSKQAILDSMMPGQKYTITDIIMSCPQVADLTNQRVAALVRQLVMSGDVIRTEDERKAYFELP